MKIIAFAASSSKNSINKKLVHFATKLLNNVEVEILDLNDFEIPLFSEDREVELGKPEKAKQFLAKIASADALVISFAEHNSSYTSAYKNLYDWCSRIQPKVFQNKPMVMLSTSPGARGGASVLAQAVNTAPFFGGVVKASLSIPQFYENFDETNETMTNSDLLQHLTKAMQTLTTLN